MGPILCDTVDAINELRQNNMARNMQYIIATMSAKCNNVYRIFPFQTHDCETNSFPEYCKELEQLTIALKNNGTRCSDEAEIKVYYKAGNILLLD